MERTLGATISVVLVLWLAAPGSRAALAGGEVSLLGATAHGDYGTGLESDSQWFTVRYITGDDLQFRVDVSMVRFQGFSGVSVAGLGPVSTGEQRRQGQNGNGVAGVAAGVDAGAGLSTTASTSLTEDLSTGLGDLFLGVSKRLTGGGVRLFRLDTNLEVKVPTADDSRNLGTGEWDYRIGFSGEYRFWSAVAFGGVGWNKLGDPPWLDLDDVLDAFIGIDSNPIAHDRLIISGWIEGWQEAVEDTGHRAAAGIGLQTTGKVRWRLQVRTGLSDAAADIGVLFGASFGVSPPGPGVRGPQL